MTQTAEQLDSWGIEPVGRVTAPLREQVIAMMRTAILDFHLRPGQRLIERELIDRFGVSRTTIREAIRDLAAEGLVTVIPQKGAIVAAPSPAESADLYDVRAHLESLTVTWFVERATDDEVHDLRAAVDRLGRVSAETPDDTPAVLTAKDDYYRILNNGARSDILKQLLTTVQARVRVLRAASLGAPGRAQAAANEIAMVMAAIERRDPEEAARLSIKHVQTAATTALRELGADDA